MRIHLGLPDATGRQTPQAIRGLALHAVQADLVLKALGFDPEDLPTAFGAPELAVTRWGTLKIDHRSMMTNLRRRVRRRRHRARRLAGGLGDPRRPRRGGAHPRLSDAEGRVSAAVAVAAE